MVTTQKWGGVLPALLAAALVLLTACGPPGPKALLEGERLIREGKPAAAIEPLKDATRHLPRNPQAWNHLGLAYHGAGRLQEAAGAYQRALTLDQGLSAARYNLGCVLLDANQPTAAQNELLSYVNVTPRDPAGWLKLGTAQMRLQQFELADRTIRQALSLNPKLPEAHNSLGMIQLRRQHMREALGFFQSALQFQPDYAPALLNLALVYHQHVPVKNLETRRYALQKYKEYLNLKPRPANAAAVQELAANLERELTPAARVTSPPSVAQVQVSTNLQAKASNALAAISSASPKPAPPPAATPKPEPPALKPDPSRADNHVASVPSPGPKPPPPPALPPKPAVTGDGARATPPPPRVIKSATEPAATLSTEFPSAPVAAPLTRGTTRTDFPPPPPPIITPAPGNPAFPSAVTTTLAPAVSPPVISRTAPIPPISPATSISSTPPPAPDSTRYVVQNEPVKISQADVEKAGFWARNNPVNLFRSKPKPARVVTPLNPGLGKQNVAVTAKSTPVPPPVVAFVAPAAPKPAPAAPAIFPHYNYRHPAPPPAGNRAEAEPLFIRAAAAQKDGDPEPALQNYRAAVLRDPAFFEAYHNLGTVAYEAGYLPESLTAFESALALNPRAANSRYNFAIALRKSGFPQDAANELERTLTDETRDVQGHFALGNLYAQQLRQPAKARTHYERVLLLNPDHPQATNLRQWLREH